MNPSVPENFDAIIIGVGQAGKPLALSLSEKGWKTAIIERKYLGGTCINYGCTPTKTMIASAHIAHLADRAEEYGVHTGKVQVDLKEVKQRKENIVKSFRQSISDSFGNAPNLTLIRGEAYFTASKVVEVALHEGGTRQLRADKIFIDCGTSPRKPDFDGIDSVDWLNSTSIMELEELPRHLLIVGGGYIGLEFSQMFKRFGSRVSLFERGPQLLGREDPDVAAAVADVLKKDGIEVYLNSTIAKVSKDTPGSVTLQVAANGQSRVFEGSHLLVALGTTPNTKTLQLGNAGVAISDKGYILVNDRLETTQAGIYALGDIKGGPAFTHISYDDYRIVKQNILGNGGASTLGRQVPYTVFTDPQLGRIGLSEKEARQKGYQLKIATLPMAHVARAIESGQTRGFMKAIVDAHTGQLLGAAILGMEGGEIMAMIQLAIMGGLPYTRLRDAVFAHPTLAESLNTLFSQID